MYPQVVFLAVSIDQIYLGQQKHDNITLEC